ncbi:MAG: nucleotidyltransferase domain-containing protein [bacterium]
MVETEILEKVKEFARTVEREGIRITKIILYGSRLAGKSHEDSDIDVAVVSPDFGEDRYEEGVKLFEIGYRIDPRIEPVPVSLEAYENDTWVPLIYEIRKTGIEVER